VLNACVIAKPKWKNEARKGKDCHLLMGLKIKSQKIILFTCVSVGILVSAFRWQIVDFLKMKKSCSQNSSLS
jgi:hypothetical protein